MKSIILIMLLAIFPLVLMAQGISAQKSTQTGRYGLVKNGKWIISPDYEDAWWDESNRLGYVEKNSLRAIVNQDGKIITDFEYSLFPISGVVFQEGPTLSNLIVVQKVSNGGDLQGIIDRNGKIIVPCIYTKLSPHDNELMGQGIIVNNVDNQYGLYYLDGRLWIEPKYANSVGPDDWRYYNLKFVNMGGSATSDFSQIVVGGKWGAIDKQGKEAIPCEYDALEYIIGENLILANKDGKRDSDGNIVGGKWGLLDDRGAVLVPCIYSDVKKTAKNLYAVNKNGIRDKDGNTTGGKWGLYANDKEIVPCQYDDAPKFDNEVATVRINGQVKLIKNPLKDASKIQIASGDKSSTKKAGGPVISRYPAPDSDVDKNIPVSKKQAENTFAFIIANENYADAPVPYSLNDGRMFKEYCLKTLGLPEKNINMYEDATFGTIITAVEKMKQLAEAYEGEASIIFYYAGHGFPDEKQSTAYLLPVDGDASSIITTGYSLAKLYTEISKLKLKSSVVFLDACFSGAKREDQMLASSRGVAIKVKDEAPQGNMVVFSAAQGDETAHQMEDKHHGLFTYFLLKELQATGGDVDMGTLTEYVTKQVKRQSVVINNKKQTPTVIPSQALVNSWKTMKLK